MTEFEDGRQPRVLLVEIVRRAAYDWVLYRSSTRLRDATIARDAYVWLFEEKPGHRDWLERSQAGWQHFAFLTICEMLDLDADLLRARIKTMSVKDVLSAGRPPVRRKKVLERGITTIHDSDIHLPHVQHILDREDDRNSRDVPLEF